MKKLAFIGVLAACLTGSLALAGTPTPTHPCPTGGCEQGTGVGKVEKVPGKKGDLSVMLTEKITVSVPAVVAMYLHENAWSVDLNDLANCNCYRAGNHNMYTGRDDTYNIKEVMARAGSVWTGDDRVVPGNAYSFAGSQTLAFNGSESHGNVKVSSYPGIEYDKNGGLVWKGPIVCYNRKIVEKFTNSTDWKVNISVDNVSAGFPTLIVGDRVAGTGYKFVETLYNGGLKKSLDFTNAQAGYAGKTTGGWLDDYILEALVFDGSETAGTKSADVNFKLTGTF